MATKKTASSQNQSHKAFDFEASLAQLEKLVTRMEDGDMSLEESLKAFEEGVKLTRLCQETLSSAQQKVQTLMEQQGKLLIKPAALGEEAFDTSDNEDDDDN